MLTNKRYEVRAATAPADVQPIMVLELRAMTPIGEVAVFADLALLRLFLGDSLRFWEFVSFACGRCDAEAKVLVSNEMRRIRLLRQGDNDA